MTDLTAQQLFAASVHLLFAVVWGSVAIREWQFVRIVRPRTPLFRLLRDLTAVGTVFYLLQALFRLVPPEIVAAPPMWLIAGWIVAEWSVIVLPSLARHLTRHWGIRLARPTPRWLAVNYGAAVAMGLLTLGFPWVLGWAARPLVAYHACRSVYLAVMFGLAVRDMAQVARRGPWRPGAAGNVIRHADVVVFCAAIGVVVLLLLLLVFVGPPVPTSSAGLAIDIAIGILTTIPIAARELHAVIRAVLLVTGLIATMVLAYLATRGLVAPIATAGAPRLADTITIVVLAAIVFPAQALLGRLVGRLIAGQQVWPELQAFLTTLSPEAGALECCRRALAEVVRVLGLSGAAIVLRNGETVVEGAFQVEGLQRVWPRGADLDALPAAMVTADYLEELPGAVVEALVDAEVTGVVAITSPRRRWGVLFGTSRVVEPSPETTEPIEAFASQLALVLDAADLIERTIAVERSLAHAEKLAAIGELAARIAHEIRNPVTAARSLAQLLARDPTAPQNAEHAQLILGELERVERQVRALLGFARREEYRLEPLDLSELARASLGALRPRLAAARVDVVEEIPPGIVVRADAEKLRQVLVNLFENALDALTVRDDERCLTVSITAVNGTATLCVSDSGAGVPDDALPRLFEPFFSLKPGGTGLGLAIARRTVEAHGGRIVAEPATPHGATFRIDLPSAQR